MRTISFSVTDEEYAALAFDAKHRGLAPSQYSKSAVIQYLRRSISRQGQAALPRKERVPTGTSIDRLQARPGYVYLAQSGNLFKIGVTRKKPHERIADLQTALPCSLVNHLYSRNPYKMESELHKKYASHRTVGEWFRFDEIPGEFR